MKKFNVTWTNIILILMNLGITACTSVDKRFSHEPNAVSIMAYNVENLFDTEHDAGTEDQTYLPLAKKQHNEHLMICQKMRNGKYRAECLELDWNEQTLRRKLQRVADVILQVNNGKGPDLLMLEEVENIKVLRQLNKEYLAPAGYTTEILIEGFDNRGIDVAMLSRLKTEGEPKLNKIAFEPKNEEDKKWIDRSRGILQQTFVLPDGQKLTAFTVHFPSQANPTSWRQQAINHLNKLKSELPPDHLSIAGGDFNISAAEDSSNHFYAKEIGEKWLVSHRIGCGDCRGTHYYHRNKEWSFLDALLFDKRMEETTGEAKWMVRTDKIGTPSSSKYQLNRFFSPARFEIESPIGVSDHLPIFAVIQPRPESALK